MAYTCNVKLTIQFAMGGAFLKNRIKEYRKKRDLTQEELADAVEVTRQTVISLENGKYVASLQLAFKLSKFFGVSIEELFTDD